MPDLAIPGVPTSWRTPGFYFALVFGGTPSNAAEQGRKGLLYANKIGTDLTGASPSFTVSAGTQADATPREYYDPDEVGLAAGLGSEAHRMAIAWFAQAPGQPVTIVFTPEAAGVKASAVITFATTATASFTIRLRLMGRVVEVSVASGDTATTIATACANAILAVPELPVTAQYSSGALTITAKQKGTRGNDLLFQAFFVLASNGVVTQIGTGSTASGAGTTGIISGAGSAVGANSDVYPLSGGTVDDTLTTALAAVAASWFDLQATAHRTSTQLDALATQLYAMSAPTVGIYQQGLTALTGTSGAAATLALGRNRELLQVVGLPVSPTPAEEIAAQQCAARIFGDVAAGGDTEGEAADPACNLIGLLHATTQRPWSPADYLTPGQVNTALLNGLTPLVQSGVGTGVQVVQSITTRCLKNGFAYYGTYDTKEVTVPQFVAKDMKADFATTFKGFKLGRDRADGTPPRTPKVTSVTGVKARAAYKLRSYDESTLRDVEARMAQLVAQENSAVTGRVDMFVPCEPMPNLSQIAVKLTQFQGGP